MEPEAAAQQDTQPARARAFSDAEKEQLAKFRQALPDIIKAAGEASTVEVSASLWGVPLLPSDANDDPRIDVILVKFLRARKNNLDQAREMLTSTLKWRAEFGVDALLDETFPSEIFGAVGYIHGTDKAGRPVTYNFYGGLDNKTVFGDLDRFLRWRVQLHERGMRMLDFADTADMLQVHDYQGVGLFSYDKFARTASRATVQLMSDNYPETLATKIFANVPAWGETIFNIIGRWLSEDTKRKFVVVGAANAYAALADRIDPKDIPDRFGKSEAAETLAAVAPSEEEKKKKDVAAATEAAASSSVSSSPPPPQPAHVDAAADLPTPSASAADNKSGGDAPQVTAAPEAADNAPNDVVADPDHRDEPTAGMRPDENKTAASSNDPAQEETIDEKDQQSSLKRDDAPPPPPPSAAAKP
ncbi:Non-classical phosphatidylinositol transfer protein (PITP) [Coemansia sp. Benny D160-2]|nr:Non-classical phosphatidylinositol transfer protein (PITP) [Coemansia sp. Benny D160-2]